MLFVVLLRENRGKIAATVADSFYKKMLFWQWLDLTGCLTSYNDNLMSLFLSLSATETHYSLLFILFS